ncbi:Na+/H+ antiporter [Thermococcus cleftensis]|uniref:Na+/H+ antiporter n=1 Tax=Thermococcus cleftensis (strain DSM 27260 / KACC 17922 / CL1) TaxID=163003 RepID=I3ZV78_THECF|nr:sodium:proton antiporter [Thermococcus cleftensis]AFL95612.1 Na+/H+ antiporter [Thermococcus cleftensis]
MVPVDLVAKLLVAILMLGVLAMVVSRKSGISYVPLFILLGVLIGPLTSFVPRSLSHELFEYVRVFGLVVILFTEGHNLSWKLLKRNSTTILLLDTIGVLVTAFLAGWFFSWLFGAPLLVGFLFGAIVSATDPATLIPLFRQYRVEQDVETTIVAESIFNDPLGIVLTTVAVAMLYPNAVSEVFSAFSGHVGIYGASVLYFLYEVIVSALVGVAMGFFGYWFIKKAEIFEFPEIEIFALGLAFLTFLVGDSIDASGYLAATVAGLVLGNFKVLGKFRSIGVMERVLKAISLEVRFNENLSAIATLFIFFLLGASLELGIFAGNLVKGLLVAYFLMLVARPLAALPIARRWGFRRYLFISLEGPRGIVPAALASLPLALVNKYGEGTLTLHWAEVILAVTVITVFASIVTETLWLPLLKKALLGTETVEERVRKLQAAKRA